MQKSVSTQFKENINCLANHRYILFVASRTNLFVRLDFLLFYYNNLYLQAKYLLYSNRHRRTLKKYQTLDNKEHFFMKVFNYKLFAASKDKLTVFSITVFLLFSATIF